ncbi:hypothetical protein C0V70_16020 [Bacteriovorax stolpii]|uniref:Uncharacterized protein n=1 Tax=Bacteriovorax stolpii TaxID=960 RepID=A0A2K9NWY8_BACTC|nr:hypothetical protein [Bacteriovorax stolpii]AUN99585.1 hypothetical protein C0V70_16020 [Bacteriovorax stolpii]TDP51215.1 hypothetical protein C8D79_3386 [Bacteriovorax stolpii]
MHYFKIIFFAAFFTLASCGKSPLFNKLEKTKEIAGSILLEEQLPGAENSFSLKWNVPPSLSELGIFEITLNSPLKTTQTLNAYIWMPDMGHGSSPIVITPLSSVSYEFSELAFIMPGLWVLHIEVLENNQVISSWQKSIVL